MPTHPGMPCSFNQANSKEEYLSRPIIRPAAPKRSLKIIMPMDFLRMTMVKRFTLVRTWLFPDLTNLLPRNQQGDIRARIVSISSNGGATWDTTYFDPNLPDPVCQGSILTIATKKSKSILAFSNAADARLRDNLTLRISMDEGKTWSRSFVVDKSTGQGQKDFTAYSDIVRLSKNKIGVLYERDGYKEIVFKVVKWN